jgi:hypothetical protein
MLLEYLFVVFVSSLRNRSGCFSWMPTKIRRSWGNIRKREDFNSNKFITESSVIRTDFSFSPIGIENEFQIQIHLN